MKGSGGKVTLLLGGAIVLEVVVVVLGEEARHRAQECPVKPGELRVDGVDEQLLVRPAEDGLRPVEDHRLDAELLCELPHASLLPGA